MTQNSEISMPMSAPVNQTTCSNCRSAMPSDLRFCRNCGFRLASSMGGGYTGGPLAGTQEVAATETASATPKRRRRMSGMSWIFVGLLIFFIGAAAFTALVAPVRNRMNIQIGTPVVKSFIGIDEFRDTEQGVMLNCVSVPDGPADKAGLLGGDLILSFDGQRVENEDQMDDLMTKTPVGKTVDVEYSRDGVKKTTKLTTISQDEFRRMSRAFERRPEGRPVFGFDDDEAERVLVPGTNIYGVKLDAILQSRPADIAGIKNGDIIIEFEGVPIRTPDEFLMRVRRALPYSTVKVVVMRGEGDQKEKVEIPVKMGKQ
jgi:membrane-associated protease RseP (regulator of RpoE activity)